MDPFRFCLALGPVAMYLVLLGAVNLSRRPLLVSGVRDVATLALAVSGLVIVGPMELFFPFEAAMRFGPHVWVLLLALYAMCVVLVLLLLRPRLVIYNISADKLRPILAELVDRLDPRRALGGRQFGIAGTGRAVVCRSLRSAALCFVGFDRPKPESAGLATPGDGAGRCPGTGGSIAQSPRLGLVRHRSVDYRGHCTGDRPRSTGSGSIIVEYRPVVSRDGWTLRRIS